MCRFLNVNNSNNDFLNLELFMDLVNISNLNDKLKMIYSKNEELYLDFPIQNELGWIEYQLSIITRARNSQLSIEVNGSISMQIDITDLGTFLT
ncbi:hypothetical protein RhiirA5_434397 [Rhizophagus irregularis]|uniref:Uncharacterized protein n=1 Tax=Rhizophagus irregularis TaxID=588596 RepID=A0A2N0NQ46_9GLOM|nr:hypothetical protein RhiirA5_434397 [Rhizophagus irregularis]